jgi:hypothetical protein
MPMGKPQRLCPPDFTTEGKEITETDRNHGNPQRVPIPFGPPPAPTTPLASLGLARWCAAGRAGELPTRGKKGSDPEPFLSDLCGLCGEIRGLFLLDGAPTLQ